MSLSHYGAIPELNHDPEIKRIFYWLSLAMAYKCHKWVEVFVADGSMLSWKDGKSM
jgi:hypothetical protein